MAGQPSLDRRACGQAPPSGLARPSGRLIFHLPGYDPRVPDDSQPGDEVVNVTAESVAAFLAAGAGIMGPPEAALLAAAGAPILVRVFERIADRVSSLRRRRCGEVYVEVTDLAAMSIEELTDRVLADERLLDLFSRVLLDVQDMALRRNRRALARSLAASALEPIPARIDVALLVRSAIRDLDEGHIRLMAVLSSEPRRPADAPPGKYGLMLAEVTQRDPGLSNGAYALLQGLLSRGLVEDSTGGGSTLIAGRTYTLSALGQRVFTQLSDEGFEQVIDFTSPIGS